MAKYRVEIFYKTKRERFCLGSEVEAFDPEEAEEIALARHIKPYPARKVVQVNVREGRNLMVSYPL